MNKTILVEASMIVNGNLSYREGYGVSMDRMMSIDYPHKDASLYQINDHTQKLFLKKKE